MALAGCATAPSTPPPGAPSPVPALPLAQPISFRDPTELAAALRPSFKACYDRELARDASVVGCVSVRIQLDSQGGVTGVTPEASALPPDLLDCVQRDLVVRRFERPTLNPAVLVVPLVFIPEGSRAKTTCSNSSRPADATQTARAAYQRALANAGSEQTRNVREAIAHYRNAKSGWLRQHQKAGGEEALFWYADSAYWVVVLQVTMNQSPLAAEVTEANAAARAVLDGSPNFGEVGAFYLVNISDKVMEDAHRRFVASNGTDGAQERKRLDLTKTGPPPPTPLPPLVQAALDARTEFLQRARIGDAWGGKKRGSMALSGAQLLLAYGQVAQAATWLETAQHEGCAVKSDVATQAKQERVALARATGRAAEAEKINREPTCPESK